MVKEDWVADGEHEVHRKAAWSELFFDLAYVAAGVKLGQNLKVVSSVIISNRNEHSQL